MAKSQSSKTGAVIDTVLKKQLQAARDRDPVSAVFTLRSATGRVLPPEKVEALVRNVVDAATQKSSQSLSQITIFKNLQSFAIQAPAAFVRSVLTHPAVSTATANVRDEELLIRPVQKKIVKLSA